MQREKKFFNDFHVLTVPTTSKILQGSGAITKKKINPLLHGGFRVRFFNLKTPLKAQK